MRTTRPYREHAATGGTCRVRRPYCPARALPMDLRDLRGGTPRRDGRSRPLVAIVVGRCDRVRDRRVRRSALRHAGHRDADRARARSRGGRPAAGELRALRVRQADRDDPRCRGRAGPRHHPLARDHLGGAAPARGRSRRPLAVPPSAARALRVRRPRRAHPRPSTGHGASREGLPRRHGARARHGHPHPRGARRVPARARPGAHARRRLRRGRARGLRLRPRAARLPARRALALPAADLRRHPAPVRPGQGPHRARPRRDAARRRLARRRDGLRLRARSTIPAGRTSARPTRSGSPSTTSPSCRTRCARASISGSSWPPERTR